MVESQLDPDANVSHRVIVRLIERSIKTNENTKSGLVRISNTKRFRLEDKKLRKELKFWIPMCFQNNEINTEILERLRLESKEFYDLNECLQYIDSSVQKRVILILYDHYAENRKIADDFIKFSQIIAIYRCISQESFENWFTHRSLENQSFIRQFLSKPSLQTPIKQLDEGSQLLLMQICLTELIINLPRTNEAKEDFLEFCRKIYEDNPTYMGKIHEFERTYEESDAIQWYSTSSSFVCQIISRTCALMDFTALFQIRFILRDLYMQLQRLHQEQLRTLLQRDLIVYRGKMMKKDEVNRLKMKGELFVTRNFLSTSTEEDVAGMFSGEGVRNNDEVSVLISMHISQAEVREKPIAFIGEYSSMRFENEVMLPMGIVFRTESYEEVHNDETYSIKIKMVRGKDEKRIEKNQSQYRLLTETGESCMITGMAIWLKSIRNGAYVEKYCQLMSEALKSANNEIIVEQLRTISDNHIQCNSVDKDMNVVNTQLQNNVFNNFIVNSMTSLSNMMIILKQHSFYLLVIFIGCIVLIPSIVIPMVTLLPSRINSSTSIDSHVICQAILDNTTLPIESYRVLRLHVNCSRTLVNMTINLIVYGTNKTSHIDQKHNFLDQSLDMEYTDEEKPARLIYTWRSRPDGNFSKKIFPRYVIAQFQSIHERTSNASWYSWQLQFQPTSGIPQNISDTFQLRS